MAATSGAASRCQLTRFAYARSGASAETAGMPEASIPMSPRPNETSVWARGRRTEGRFYRRSPPPAERRLEALCLREYVARNYFDGFQRFDIAQ